MLNDTDNSYQIHYAYSTVANGSADRIVLAPGEVAAKITAGGSSDFAEWHIGSPNEFDGREILNLSDVVITNDKGACQWSADRLLCHLTHKYGNTFNMSMPQCQPLTPYFSSGVRPTSINEPDLPRS